MKKLLIFDLDGTLLDTLDDLRNSVNYALKLYNYPERTLEQIRNSVGNGFARLVSTSLPEGAADGEAVLKTARGHYAEHFCVETKPYDGILLLLAQLKAEGHRLAIVSNKPDEMLQSLYRRFFSELVEYAAGEIAGIPRKPQPDPVYGAMAYFGAEKQDTVYIGDSEVDYQTSINSGVKPIIVGWGFRRESELRAAGVDRICADMNQLYDMICE